jgi:hypothetical protein
MGASGGKGGSAGDEGGTGGDTAGSGGKGGTAGAGGSGDAGDGGTGGTSGSGGTSGGATGGGAGVGGVGGQGGAAGAGSGGASGKGGAAGAGGVAGTAGKGGSAGAGGAGAGGKGGAAGAAGTPQGGAGGNGGSVVVVNATARGWYKETGEHLSTNNNTITGVSYSVSPPYYSFNSYITFTVPSFTGTVTGVTLRVEHESYMSADPSETVAMYDVLTAAATLEATPGTLAAGLPTYADLGMGTTYGSFMLTAATAAPGVDAPGTVIDVPLNASGVSAVSSARGSAFSIGFRLTSGSNADARMQFIRFSFQDETRTHQLVITTTP